jgi:hypothetical protein
MIFDDHDIRDDWNASLSWKKKMEPTSWWHDRIVAGLASYWSTSIWGTCRRRSGVRDAIWQQVVRHEGEAELDLSGAGQFRGTGRPGPDVVPMEPLPGFRWHAANGGVLPLLPEAGAGRPRPA